MTKRLTDDEAEMNHGPFSSVTLIIDGITEDLILDGERNDHHSYVGNELGNQLGQLSIVATSEGTNNGELVVKFNEPPVDKGYAWVVALCGTLAIFATWGANAGYGIFLNYYLSNNTFPGATKYDFALIGSLVFFCGLALSPVAALLYNVFGFRILIIIGIILQTAAYIMASFATQLWQLYLTQGILVGVALVIIFLPTTLVLPTHFDHYLSTAMGIAALGIGLGGLVYSFCIHAVIETYGSYRWALRMVGLSSMVACLIAAIFIKPRVKTQLPLKQTLTKKFISENYKIIFNYKIFKLYPMISLSMWYGLAFLGYVLCLFSLAPYATLMGLNTSQGTIITALVNVGQMIGRPCMGLFADKFGRHNFTIIMNSCVAILIYAWWINASSFGSLIGFSVMLGLFFGVSSTMGQSLAFDIVENPKNYPGSWSGLNAMGGVFALVSEVIALKLVRTNSTKPYLHAQIFAGSCFAGGIIFLLINREWLVRRKLSRWRDEDLLSKTGSDIETVENRIRRYDLLLKKNIFSFTLRMFYPTRT